MNKASVTGLALALILGAASVSQAQQATRRGERPRARQELRAGQQGPAFQALLRGITLTDEQKAKVQELREKQRAEAQDDRDDLQKRRAEMQEARAKNDTTKVRELRAKAQDEMRERREHMMHEIRELLTPDQRTIFDKNVAEAQTRMQNQRGRRGDA